MYTLLFCMFAHCVKITYAPNFIVLTLSTKLETEVVLVRTLKFLCLHISDNFNSSYNTTTLLFTLLQEDDIEAYMQKQKD